MPRPYRARSRPARSEQTRERIKTAVRELLAEGAFHESTVEQVAERAGVARATLYQHFRSRLELVDSVCESFDANPALLELRRIVADAEPDTAIARTTASAIRFWASEDPVLRQLYGVAAIDPAAQALVDRQRADRRRELERLVVNLEQHGRLGDGVDRGRALTLLLVLTSYETYRELRQAGLDDDQATTLLQRTAAELLLAPQ